MLKYSHKIKDDKDYERQNIFYKAVLRDFRRFIINDFKKLNTKSKIDGHNFKEQVLSYSKYVNQR